MPAFALLFVVVLGIPTQAPSQADVERLTLVGPDSRVIGVVEGGPSRVVIEPEIDALLLRPGAGITMVHNHPSGVGLSVLDLLQLAKPGVVAIVANGEDGSRYQASRAARYDADHFEAVQYKTAHDQVLWGLLAERSHDPTLPTFDGLIAHLTSVALQKAQVVEYRATLAGPRDTQWSTYRPLLGHITEAAAAKVRALRPVTGDAR